MKNPGGAERGGPALDIAAEMAALRAELEAERAREEAADARIGELLRAQAEAPRQLGLVLQRMRGRLALVESDAGS